MTYLLKFYRTERGDVPALEYLRSQPKAHRARIGRALRGLQHRLLYFFHARAIIVVTSGFLKNMERLPEVELHRAQVRRRDWLTHFEERP